jgi:hypothetical protein
MYVGFPFFFSLPPLVHPHMYLWTYVLIHTQGNMDVDVDVDIYSLQPTDLYFFF